jgi:hypothetical protein
MISLYFLFFAILIPRVITYNIIDGTTSNKNNLYIPKSILNLVGRDDFIPTSDTDSICYKPPIPGTWEKKPPMITISPGGIYGFYTLGTCAYIKENYNLTDYLYSGASAGSWNSLYMVLKNDYNFSKGILDIDTDNISSIFELEYAIKNSILNLYSTKDFDLTRVFIGVTVFKKKKLRTSIYSDFEDLKDAIDCCIASSHIPFVTGGAIKRYKDILSFDGGFSKYPYIRNVEPVLHIEPSMWNKNKKVGCSESHLFNFKKNRHLITDLFNRGYNDALKNKEFLDKILNAV